MIGAIVLVVFAVIVVPVFLDGPGDDAAVISEPVILPGQNDQPRRQQTIVLERDRKEPVPVAAAAPQPEPATPEPRPVAKPEPESVTPRPDPVRPVIEKSKPSAAKQEQPGKAPPADKPPPPAPAPESESGLWAVQLGSFSKRDNAERLAAGLRAEGYAAFLSKLDTASGQLHRVRIGPQKDRDSAETVAKTLSSSGHDGQVVPHP